MIKKSGSKTSIVSTTDVPRLDMLKTEGTREKAKSARQPTTVDTPKQRGKAEQTIQLLASPPASTERQRKEKSTRNQPKAIKLTRLKSEKAMSRVGNNKKEKPSGQPAREKPDGKNPLKSLFSRRTKPAKAAAPVGVPDAANAEAAPPPSSSRDACCRDMVRIFSEKQYAHLCEPLQRYLNKKALVGEVGLFLEEMSAYSQDHLPTAAQAQTLFDTYLANDDAELPLNITAATRDKLQHALNGGDMKTFYETVMGGPNEPADEYADAVLPQLADANWPHYVNFVESRTGSK